MEKKLAVSASGPLPAAGELSGVGPPHDFVVHLGAGGSQI